MPENTSTIDGRDELRNRRYIVCMYACDRFACGSKSTARTFSPSVPTAWRPEQRRDGRLADVPLQVDDGYAQRAFAHVCSRLDGTPYPYPASACTVNGSWSSRRHHAVGQVVDQAHEEVPGTHRWVADAQFEVSAPPDQGRHRGRPSGSAGSGATAAWRRRMAAEWSRWLGAMASGSSCVRGE